MKRAGTLFDGPEDRPVIQEVMAQAVRVVGQHRHLYAFGPADVYDGCKVAQVVELVWDKGAMGLGDLSLPWGPQHETIQFTVSKHRHGGEKGAGTLAARMRQGSVLLCARPGARRHPNEKPVAILRQMVESSSVLGEVVLDPFAGSGSTGVAALLEGRRTFLVELDERYIDTITTRLAEAEAWLDTQPA